MIPIEEFKNDKELDSLKIDHKLMLLRKNREL